MTAKVRLDHAGLGEVLKSAGVAAAVSALAGQVAAGVEAQGLTVESGSSEHPDTPLAAEVETAVTDRAKALVVIKHPAGVAMQARHGVLTRAAASAGLEVR